MSTREPRPFPFLSLLAELRLMVYTFVARTTGYHGYYAPTRDVYLKAGYTVLKRQGLSVVVLATCKFILAEAQPFFDKHLTSITSEPMRFVVSTLLGRRFGAEKGSQHPCSWILI
jgi:hypothetical protein